MDRRYWPRQFQEMAEDAIPTSLINEPVLDNVIPLPKPAHSLRAVLCDALTSNRGLLQRLESSGGVQAPPGAARIVVRELYVSVRRTVQALSAALEQDLE